MSELFIHCPIAYRENCALYEISCSKCGANNESHPFRYSPISTKEELSYRKHPYYLKVTKESRERLREERRQLISSSEHKRGVKSNREGRKIENRIIEKIGARSTLASGARYEKGDGVIRIGDREYRIEHKSRLNGKNILGPKKEEWEKGRWQRIDIFITTDAVTNKSIVTMDLNIFNEILGIEESNAA
ncbi:hypothetical protein H6G33_10425 [Calothrix sp. FACHB-1219]|uniref:hypothetical protein n=1 Tax=unclassified Calothrix TaxID=2619626 RepID=UPI00168772BE|nr:MULTISPECIES: hypothetical protein [unclassified Calothrix]MBD2201762.1 hypothetical protein [Calothrix sp. FACHB-168]MBD2217448.1 hypothetical protein [Calothrix sp. FACHB-1219]